VKKLLIIAVLSVLVLALVGCSSDDEDTGGNTSAEGPGDVNTPAETSGEATPPEQGTPVEGNDIDSKLIGTWGKYDGDVVVHDTFLVITEDGIERTGRDMLGGEDGIIYAEDGQIYVDFDPDNPPEFFDYGYDYTLADNGNTMYFLEERTDEFTDPGPDTPHVMLLRKQ